MTKIPGEVVFKPPAAPKKPKPVVGPQNVGLPTYRPGDVNNPYPAAPAPPAPVAAPAAPAPPPPPVDYMAQALTDPQYTQNIADINRGNTNTLADLLKGYLGQSQSSQDSFNAHGGLFSGAAVNAQTQAGAGYDQAVTRQTENTVAARKNAQFAVYNRLLQQLAGGS